MTDFETWGPVFWWVLHCIAANYAKTPTENERQDMVTFMNKLANFLPCPTCRNHLKDYLSKHDIYPSTVSREQLERYIFELHEDVNTRNRKAQKHTFEEVQKAFESGKPWKEFGGYPIKNSPRYTNVDSSQFFAHFNTLENNKNDNSAGSTNLVGEPGSESNNSVMIGLIVVGIVLVLVVVGFISYAVIVNKKNKTQTKKDSFVS